MINVQLINVLRIRLASQNFCEIQSLLSLLIDLIDHNLILRIHESQIIVTNHRIIDIIRQQIDQDLLPCLVVELIDPDLFDSLVVDLVSYLQNDRLQFPLIHRLHEITERTAAHRLPGIFEIRITAQDDHFPLVTGLSCLPENFGPEHVRQPDVEQHQAGLIHPDLVERILRVARLCAYAESEPVPVDDIPETFSYEFLIIHDEYVYLPDNHSDLVSLCSGILQSPFLFAAS
ncbi:unknown [Firmicutes bacterium CAG:791]|nr:unknown [Firmicutes bacterium CAG:791]